MGLNQQSHECIYYFNIILRRGYFHIWETVIKREKNISLSEQQKKLLKELLNLSDKDGTILYVNDMPRPSEPWYETVRKIVAKLIVEPFKTYEIYSDIYHESWLEIEHFVNNDASGLSLPEGVSSPIKVIPPDIRHKLWLQECFDSLSGLGQNDELTLEDKKQKSWKVESFIRSLREQKESVNYFNLTLEELLKSVKMPPKDEKILVESLFQELGMKSVSDRLSDVL